MAAALIWSHFGTEATVALDPGPQAIAGLLAGFAIGMVATVMGVAGGELLIPTIVLLYAVDIKLAGSLSLVVSLPTMLVAFTRYSRDQSRVSRLGIDFGRHRCVARHVGRPASPLP